MSIRDYGDPLLYEQDVHQQFEFEYRLMQQTDRHLISISNSRVMLWDEREAADQELRRRELL
jgi:hypothetical protein